MEYDIIVASNRFALLTKVREHIALGWVPLGGITVAAHEQEVWQSMTRGNAIAAQRMASSDRMYTIDPEDSKPIIIDDGGLGYAEREHRSKAEAHRQAKAKWEEWQKQNGRSGMDFNSFNHPYKQD